MSATSRENDEDEKVENQLDSPLVDDEVASGVDDEKDEEEDTADEVGVAAMDEAVDDGVAAGIACVGDVAGDEEATTCKSEAEAEVVSGVSGAVGE